MLGTMNKTALFLVKKNRSDQGEFKRLSPPDIVHRGRLLTCCNTYAAEDALRMVDVLGSVNHIGYAHVFLADEHRILLCNGRVALPEPLVPPPDPDSMSWWIAHAEWAIKFGEISAEGRRLSFDEPVVRVVATINDDNTEMVSILIEVKRLGRSITIEPGNPEWEGLSRSVVNRGVEWMNDHITRLVAEQLLGKKGRQMRRLLRGGPLEDDGGEYDVN